MQAAVVWIWEMFMFLVGFGLCALIVGFLFAALCLLVRWTLEDSSK